MRINRYSMHRGRLPLWPIFLAGLLAGMLIMNMEKSLFLENTGVLDEYSLYHMKYMTVDSSALFYYVLRIRLKSILTLVVFATTYLGLVVCIGASFWYGLSAGSFLAAVMIRYGIKGLLFAFTGIFPQYILYVPAMVGLLIWCENVNRSIYFRSTLETEQEGGNNWPKRLLKLVMIILMFLLGCLLESFVNPGIMSKLLNIF